MLAEQAGVVLGPAIAENSSLKSLDLSWNSIRRKGAKAIADGIKVNITFLTRLIHNTRRQFILLEFAIQRAKLYIFYLKGCLWSL